MKKAPPLPDIQIDEGEYKRRSRRSILLAAVAGALGLAGFEWVKHTAEDRSLPWFLRRGLDAGDRLFKANFRNSAMAPRKGPAAKPIRTNGDTGMEDKIDLAKWRLTVTDPGRPEPLILSLDDIKRLPAVETAFEFKCIEGWSQNVECRGARFSDFMRTFNVGFRAAKGTSGLTQVPYDYAGLTSINGGYYVSMDQKSLMHPETLLCYEMSGQPLDTEHGAPLRLMTPVKYGVKNIKQIGEIAFTDTLPDDYWAESGYGDYLGL